MIHHMDRLKKIIIDRLDELNLSPIEAAIKGGLERGYIRDFLEGRKKTFRQDKIPLLAAALDINVNLLTLGEDPPSTSREKHQPNARIVGSIDFNDTKKIPVYGHAVGGENGEFPMNGAWLFDVLCPPRLSDIEGAYAVIVSGDSMYPRYMDGEIVYLDPTRRVRRGDFVVAQVMIDEFDTPHAFVKRFVQHNAKELVLEQFNPEQELRFPHTQVVSVHYIAMSGDVIE